MSSLHRTSLQRSTLCSSTFVLSAATLCVILSPARAAAPPTTPPPRAKETIRVQAQRRSFQQNADTLSLFQDTPGFSAYSAGGTASLPVLNGMADDRVATFVDGMRLTADCPNHMNPALSQIDIDAVGNRTAIAGITPVSLGGDSTGGSISVERKAPQFAKPGHLLITGQGREDWRSNGGESGASGSLTVANDTLSLRYNASYAHASDYRAGGEGGRVLSTRYLTYNHAVTAGIQHNHHMLSLTFGQQDIPYEAFPNQYMDETNNRSTFVNGKYTGHFNALTLEVRSYWQRVSHAMNTLSDKGGHGATYGMPMNTDGRTAGYSITATLTLTPSHHLKMGSAFDHNGLNDWWPPLLNSMMMGPGTFHNLNHAHRDHLGHFVQWNAQWTPRFSTEMGMRSDIIMMNTGPVTPYNWMGMMNMNDANAAKAFNAQKRGHTDANFDATILTRWHVLDELTIEGGYGRKTRSPNLYERYAWAKSSMSSKMIGWFGDGNGYVGNRTLSPEIAHTASLTFTFHDTRNQRWNLMVQPFYTYTQHYINVVRIRALSGGNQLLQFQNHRAQHYGINASAQYHLWDTVFWGQGHLVTTLNWVKGQDLATHSGLYQQMPLNGRVALHETLGPWNGHIELTLVKSKHTVDWLRSEPRTPGYALLGLGVGYRWRFARFDLSLENLLNQRYALPLGGRALLTQQGRNILPNPVLGMGRSVNMTLRESF